MDGDRLHIPKVGWVRLEGGGLYRHKPKQVRIRKEGTEDHPKWYAYVFHEVPVDRLKPDRCDWGRPQRGPGHRQRRRGVRSAGRPEAGGEDQAGTEEGQVAGAFQANDPCPTRSAHRGTVEETEACRSTERRPPAQSQVRADRAHTVVLEDLNTKDMTRSAKGTVEEPGQNVKQGRAQPRDTDPTGAASMNKAGQTLKVPPAYTSQTCARADTSARRIARHRHTSNGHADTLRTQTAMPKTSWRGAWPCARRPAGMGLLHGERRSVPVRCLGQWTNRPRRPVNKVCRHGRGVLFLGTQVYKSQK